MPHLPLSEYYISLLEATQQSPKYHAEGNVYIHTCNVLERYLDYKEKNEISDEEHTILYWACVLHDIGKPKVTRLKGDSWSAKGHEEAGVSIARNILLQNPEVSTQQRRKILDLVRWHHIPLRWMLEQRPLIDFQLLATQTDLKRIGLFAQFDIEGRECQKKDEILDLCKTFNEVLVPKIENDFGSFPFMQYQYEEVSLQHKNAIWRAYSMPNPQMWAKLLRSGSPTEVKPFFHAIMTIGVPKSGKTTYIKTHYPDAYILSTKGWDINDVLPQDIYEKQRILTIINHHLSVYSRHHKQIVLDGENLFPETRKEIINIIKDLNGKITYLFFDVALDKVVESYPEEKETIEAAYNILRFPHEWEAHEVTIIS